MTGMTGRHNLSAPVVTKDSQKNSWYIVVASAVLWLFVKCFQVTSGIVSVFLVLHRIYGRSSDDHCLRSPRLEQSNDALLEVSFDASAEELPLSCRITAKWKKWKKKNKTILMQTLQTELWISSKTRYTEDTDTYLHFPQLDPHFCGSFWLLEHLLQNLRSTCTSTFPHPTLIPTAATLQSCLTFCHCLFVGCLAWHVMPWLGEADGRLPSTGSYVLVGKPNLETFGCIRWLTCISMTPHFLLLNHIGNIWQSFLSLVLPLECCFD